MNALSPQDTEEPDPEPDSCQSLTSTSLSDNSSSLQIDLKRGSCAMLISLACFTGNALLLKYLANSHVDPAVSMTFRFVTGLVVTMTLFSPKIWLSFTHWMLASRGVLGCLGTAAYYSTVGPLGVGKATLIGNTWTVFSAVLAAILLKERITLRRIVALVLAIVGIALLSEVSAESFGRDGKWELIALVGAVLAALVVIVIRQLTRTADSATIFASQCVYGLLMTVPFALNSFSQLGWNHIGLLLLAGLCASAGQLAMTEGFRFLTVAGGAAFQVLVPLTIALGGFICFGEHFSAVQALGAAFILLGSWVAVKQA